MTQLGGLGSVLVCGALLLAVPGCGNASDLAGPEPTTRETRSTAPTTVIPPPTQPPTTFPTTTSTTTPTTPPTPTATTTPAGPPSAGSCLHLPPADLARPALVGAPPRVHCSERHNAQVAFVGTMNADLRRAVADADVSRIASLTDGVCRRNVVSWLDTDEAGYEISRFQYLVTTPSRSDTAAGASWFTCMTYALRRPDQSVTLPRSVQGLLSSHRADDYGTCAKGSIKNAGNDAVICTVRHNWRAISAIRFGGANADYPGDATLRGRAKPRCSSAVGDYVKLATYDYGYTWPSRATWRCGDRYGLCYAKVAH